MRQTANLICITVNILKAKLPSFSFFASNTKSHTNPVLFSLSCFFLVQTDRLVLLSPWDTWERRRGKRERDGEALNMHQNLPVCPKGPLQVLDFLCCQCTARISALLLYQLLSLLLPPLVNHSFCSLNLYLHICCCKTACMFTSAAILFVCSVVLYSLLILPFSFCLLFYSYPFLLFSSTSFS